MIADVPHLALPLRMDRHGFAQVEQDTVDDVVQCVGVIVRTPVGAREVLPEFGIPDMTFDAATIADLEDAVGLWEPRAVVDADEELSVEVRRVMLTVTGAVDG